MKKIILATLILAAFAAQAADESWYAGLNATSLKFSAKGDSESTGAAGGFIGYRMGNLAGEVSRIQKSAGSATGSINDFSLLNNYSVANGVEVFGKVGVRYSEISNARNKLSGTSLVLGAGVQYAFMPNLITRVGVDYSNKTFGESLKTTSINFGVAYKF